MRRLVASSAFTSVFKCGAVSIIRCPVQPTTVASSHAYVRRCSVGGAGAELLDGSIDGLLDMAALFTPCMQRRQGFSHLRAGGRGGFRITPHRSGESVQLGIAAMDLLVPYFVSFNAFRRESLRSRVVCDTCQQAYPLHQFGTPFTPQSGPGTAASTRKCIEQDISLFGEAVTLAICPAPAPAA